MSKLLQTCHQLGLHPLVGFGMAAVDTMLFGAEGLTAGASWPISVVVGIGLAVPTILIQRFGYKEDLGLAVGKGLMVGLLTAIPTSLPSLLTGAGGVVGTVALLSGDRALPETTEG